LEENAKTEEELLMMSKWCYRLEFVWGEVVRVSFVHALRNELETKTLQRLEETQRTEETVDEHPGSRPLENEAKFQKSLKGTLKERTTLSSRTARQGMCYPK
jgi:hypothetical protein